MSTIMQKKIDGEDGIYTVHVVGWVERSDTPEPPRRDESTPEGSQMDRGIEGEALATCWHPSGVHDRVVSLSGGVALRAQPPANGCEPSGFMGSLPGPETGQ